MMNPEHWEKLAQLFESAQQRSPADRASFLAEACGNDVELRQEVESLLSEDERRGGFMALSAAMEAERSDGMERMEAETESTVPALDAGAASDGPVGTLLQNRYFIERRLGA